MVAGHGGEARELTRSMIVPMKGVKFDFPTDYEDTSVEGDKLWDKLMPSKWPLSIFERHFLYSR